MNAKMQNAKKSVSRITRSRADEKYEKLCITFSAAIDTGSPISLIKSEFVPNNLIIIKSAVKIFFFWYNGAKLDIIGIFETNGTINTFCDVL